MYKRAEDSKEEKARKDRRRQERRFEKDMKERRLGPKKMDLKKGEDLFRKAKENVDAADLVDNGMIRVIEDKIRIRETRERQEREWVERERAASIWQEQQVEREKKDREAAEAIKKRRAEEWAAAEKQQEEQFRRWQNHLDSQYPYIAEQSTFRASKVICNHNGWWPKVHSRTACPECHEIWTFLLQCPECKIKVCPKFQSTKRPRRNRRAPSRVWTSYEDNSYEDHSYDCF
ncbi:uncharacterized protein RSE6_09649 [Rhynchosporium secalis]|uniref:Uncharacterized protein n=1 Tax=Rhynchosporium secalis TaxID=38038 RepID=A0A1E1MIJ1_RHYSE|nr:uncharacterized protein RSE6_09649 [Rhynchosporium secalis]